MKNQHNHRDNILMHYALRSIAFDTLRLVKGRCLSQALPRKGKAKLKIAALTAFSAQDCKKLWTQVGISALGTFSIEDPD